MIMDHFETELTRNTPKMFASLPFVSYQHRCFYIYRRIYKFICTYLREVNLYFVKVIHMFSLPYDSSFVSKSQNAR